MCDVFSKNTLGANPFEVQCQETHSIPVYSYILQGSALSSNKSDYFCPCPVFPFGLIFFTDSELLGREEDEGLLDF